MLGTEEQQRQGLDWHRIAPIMSRENRGKTVGGGETQVATAISAPYRCVQVFVITGYKLLYWPHSMAGQFLTADQGKIYCDVLRISKETQNIFISLKNKSPFRYKVMRDIQIPMTQP